MTPDKSIEGKLVLVVDDEIDILEILIELLNICKIETASTFEEAKKMLMEIDYDITILDIMGVNGYQLLKIAKSRKIPAVMLTAHALSREDLKRSAEEGAAYFAPKEKLSNIRDFVGDVLEAVEKGKSPWKKVFDRLGSFYDKKFHGPDWRKQEQQFWEKKMKQRFPF